VSATAIAIIVAGGTGDRFGAATPKQFLPLLGKPLLAHALAPFESCESIESLVLVLPAGGFAGYRETMAPFYGHKPVRVVPGGATRQDSTWEGLRAIDRDGGALVAVHDGARPLADSELIARVVTAAAETGAAIAGVPVVETLKEVSGDDTIVGTVDRRRFCRAQTPQCFRVELLRRGFDEARADGFIGTDEAALVERVGATIRVVVGSEHNIKVTSPEDWARAETFMKLREARS